MNVKGCPMCLYYYDVELKFKNAASYKCVSATKLLSLNLRMPLRTKCFYATRVLSLNLRMPLRTNCVGRI